MASSTPAPAPTSVTNRQTLRIQSNFQALLNNPLAFVLNLEHRVVDGLNELSGILIGPENSAYAGGHFRFVMRFPPEYPFKPPDFIFATAICHPNVHTGTGAACHDQLLATWASNITLTKILTEMHSLLAEPNYDVPIEGDTLAGKSPEKACAWTQQFAQPGN